MAEPKENIENSTSKNQEWDGIYKKEGHVFREVQENMPEVLGLLKEKGVKDVLDLGCGTGRHSVFLAENGMRVSGIDASSEGVRLTQEQMASKGLNGDFRAGDIYERLPYADASFEAIVSTQTMHHNTIEKIRELIKEMERVLTPGGTIFITVRRRENPDVGNGAGEERLADRTFAPTSGGEKGLPHYYFDEDRLAKEFSDFKSRIWIEKDGRHLCILGERKEQKEE